MPFKFSLITLDNTNSKDESTLQGLTAQETKQFEKLLGKIIENLTNDP
jgi:hypothetical protein